MSGYDCADELEERARDRPLLPDRCEARGCRSPGLAFSNDGDFLCEEHFGDWIARITEEMRDHAAD